jgi:hypothetical protein
MKFRRHSPTIVRRAQGTGRMYAMAARHDSNSWNAGYAAGLAGKRSKCPDNVEDEQAWYSGYIEGQAERERLQPRPTR